MHAQTRRHVLLYFFPRRPEFPVAFGTVSEQRQRKVRRYGMSGLRRIVESRLVAVLPVDHASLKMNLNASKSSEHPPSQNIWVGTLAVRQKLLVGFDRIVSSFPKGGRIRSTLLNRGKTHRYTVQLNAMKVRHNRGKNTRYTLL